MLLIDPRPSDAPGVQQVWTARSCGTGSFVSVASAHWELVVTRDPEGRASIIVRGPELGATHLNYQPDMAWWGIRFGLAWHLSAVPYHSLVGSWVPIPLGSGPLDRLAIPERADMLVAELTRRGALVYDPDLAQLLARDHDTRQPRTIQRHIRRATGMSRRTIVQIERARTAMDLLRGGTTILDTVAEAGYYDQAHLCRALKRWTGQTPTEHAAGPGST